MKNLKLLLVVFFLLSGLASQAAKVDTLAIPSTAMGKTYNAAVVLPNSYSKSKAKYPVMYLLHGAYGHFRDWLKSTPNKMTIKDLANQYDIIIVMPEGETFSFYLDSPVNKGSQFETYITKEVVQKIDQTYRTIHEKKGRVITGLSMGGHGALYLATKHPDLYAAAGSMSGAVDMGTMKNMGVDAPERIDKLMEPVFGPEGAPQEVYAAHAVLNMIDKMKANALPLIIDCGVDDFLIGPNRELHRRLVYGKVSHEYTERPGAHTWEYWENALPYHALFFSKIFKANGTVAQ
ncbi:S-formylglutathione hydrolase FrmB [Flavobacterium endophyticum]|uniref:S-formylglutathione hydrolase FrmB n=1 Tax=Flavobacterium endophyticum TaxID=1540163 RepID=A0A495MLT5_9FLAO|nr:alpha/beta hydrolase family protein [Flavobacterium endophyticum]RKS25309.1 S-formylglutathione hydrolase FrmB [Flavobacterium endophyticum]